jgi:hypothetical protein
MAVEVNMSPAVSTRHAQVAANRKGMHQGHVLRLMLRRHIAPGTRGSGCMWVHHPQRLAHQRESCLPSHKGA